MGWEMGAAQLEARAQRVVAWAREVSISASRKVPRASGVWRARAGVRSHPAGGMVLEVFLSAISNLYSCVSPLAKTGRTELSLGE